MGAVMVQIHSAPADAGAGPCRAVARLPEPRLRPFVSGYSGFRTRPGPSRRRFFPLAQTTVIIDFAGPARLVTGPRAIPTLYEDGWRHGVAFGLTPAGVFALLGMPMAELTGVTGPLEDLLGRRAGPLVDELGEAPDWAARFAVLDRRLGAWLAVERTPDALVTRAWWRLQEPPGRLTIEALADELGASRRYLELGFRRQIGLPPKTVARIARFQRAAYALSRPSATLAAAVASGGFADQPHFTREVRAMSGVTPTELFAFLQDVERRAP
jgi:AraC-like DNA-binding protein